jgi:acetylglutamate kinase
MSPLTLQTRQESARAEASAGRSWGGPHDKQKMTTVLKIGGELLEDAGAVSTAAEAIVRLATAGPLVVVHGGGRAIDAELAARGQTPRFVDGLRITDEGTIDTVVSVLGRTNTALVAAVGVAGGRAVGLTGADGQIGRCSRAERLETVSGDTVDLGLVGTPDGTDASLLADLVRIGWIPIVASIGVDHQGVLLNVNADVLAAHLARVLPAGRLIVAGTTVGVLNGSGQTIPELGVDDIDEMTSSGVVHSGMVAKLVACRGAFTSGVSDVAIVGGRGALDYSLAPGTRIVARCSVPISATS